jgi:hypothetical protein
MKVRKFAPKHEPQYPSQRQFADYKRVLGVAAIGITAAAGWAGSARAEDAPARLLGDVAVEPKQIVPACKTTNAVPAQSEVRLPGDLKAMPPAPAGVPPMNPKKAATNAQGCATSTTTSNASPVRLRGEMPAATP